MLKFLNMNTLKQKRKVQVIILAESEILLLKLAENRGGFWQNITGGVDENEDFSHAAIRELWEETGIKASVIEIPFEFNFVDRWNRAVTEKVYLCKLDQKINPALSEEHSAFLWKKIDEISSTDYGYETNFKPLEWIIKNENTI
jgi:8-oxo-dGTP pyrophosphatase MutT (NUDIX family)